MTNFLETILAQKRTEVAVRKKEMPVARLKEKLFFTRPTRSLRDALARRRPAVIAEIKKASPSKGVLRASFDHRQIASQYIAGGASALSILTDKGFFQGDISFLEDIAAIASVPLLRKDFVIDSYQIIESKACGADAILLIAAALESEQLAELHREAEQFGLECLVEVHAEHEIETLNGTNVRLLGINNRDLATFETDLGTTARLKMLVPSDITIVSESGIGSPADVRMLADEGVHALLIGELFMRSSDPGVALKGFLAEVHAS